jgi:biopolymer transport protein ExbB
MQADLSVWGMYQHADIVVKIVMIGLILASVVTWAIFFSKSAEMIAHKRRLKREQQLLAEARSLDQASDIASSFHAKSLTTQLINEARTSWNSPQVVKITKALKSVPVSAWSVALPLRAVIWAVVMVIWRPSARFPRSSVCLVPSGAS